MCMIYEFTHSHIHPTRAFHERDDHSIEIIKAGIDRASEIARVIQRQKDFASHYARVGQTTTLDASILPRTLHRVAPGRVNYADDLTDKEFEKLLEEKTEEQITKGKRGSKRGYRGAATGSRSDKDLVTETDKDSVIQTPRGKGTKKSRRSAAKKVASEPSQDDSLVDEDDDEEDTEIFSPTVAAFSNERNAEQPVSTATGCPRDRGGVYRKTAGTKGLTRLSGRPPQSPASSSLRSLSAPPFEHPDGFLHTSRSRSRSPLSSPSSGSFGYCSGSPMERCYTLNRPAQGCEPTLTDCRQSSRLGIHCEDDVEFASAQTPTSEDYRRNGVARSPHVVPVEDPRVYYHRDDSDHMYSQTPTRKDYRRDDVARSSCDEPLQTLRRDDQSPSGNRRLYQTARRPSTARSNVAPPQSSHIRSPSASSPDINDYWNAPSYDPRSPHYNDAVHVPHPHCQQPTRSTFDEPLFRHIPQTSFDHDESGLMHSMDPLFKRRRLHGFDEMDELRTVLQDGLGQIRRDIAIGAARSHT